MPSLHVFTLRAILFHWHAASTTQGLHRRRERMMTMFRAMASFICGMCRDKKKRRQLHHLSGNKDTTGVLIPSKCHQRIV